MVFHHILAKFSLHMFGCGDYCCFGFTKLNHSVSSWEKYFKQLTFRKLSQNLFSPRTIPASSFKTVLYNVHKLLKKSPSIWYRIKVPWTIFIRIARLFHRLICSCFLYNLPMPVTQFTRVHKSEEVSITKDTWDQNKNLSIEASKHFGSLGLFKCLQYKYSTHAPTVLTWNYLNRWLFALGSS